MWWLPWCRCVITPPLSLSDFFFRHNTGRRLLLSFLSLPPPVISLRRTALVQLLVRRCSFTLLPRTLILLITATWGTWRRSSSTLRCLKCLCPDPSSSPSLNPSYPVCLYLLHFRAILTMVATFSVEASQLSRIMLTHSFFHSLSGLS